MKLKKTTPPHGDTRTYNRFVLWPRVIENHWVWLEFVKRIDKYGCDPSYGTEGWFLIHEELINK